MTNLQAPEVLPSYLRQNNRWSVFTKENPQTMEDPLTIISFTVKLTSKSNEEAVSRRGKKKYKTVSEIPPKRQKQKRKEDFSTDISSLIEYRLRYKRILFFFLTFLRCLLTHLVKVFFCIASRSSTKERENKLHSV